VADPDPRRISRACAAGNHGACPGEVFRIPPDPQAGLYVPCEDPCGHPPPARSSGGLALTPANAERLYVRKAAHGQAGDAAAAADATRLLNEIAATEHTSADQVAERLASRVRASLQRLHRPDRNG